MPALLTDLRHGLHQLRQRPGYAATIILTLMLGIGAVAAIFTVYDAVLLKPLPFTESARIVRVLRDQPPVRSSPIATSTYADWAERSGTVFDAIGAWAPQTLNLTGSGAAQRLSGYQVSPGFWAVFSQPLALGRGISDDDETSGEHVVVLSDALWRSSFAADPSVVGRDIMLNGEAWRVIGVTTPGFHYPADARLWTPTFLPARPADRGNNMLAPVARLAPGVTREQAQAALRGITEWQAATFPDNYKGLSARVERLGDLAAANLRTSLSILLAAAFLVLLIACANIAGLVLTRTQSRAQELSIRRALGASRRALVHGMLVETLMLAVVGTGAALLFAQAVVHALLRLVPDLLPGWNAPSLDLRVVAACSALMLLALLLFGLIPAWRASGADPATVLGSGARGQIAERGQTRARRVLIVFELALSLTLLSGAGLLVDSLYRVASVDSGLRGVDQVLSAGFSLPAPTPQGNEDFLTAAPRIKAALAPRLDAVRARLLEIPGVTAAAISNFLPASGDGGFNGGFSIPGHEVPDTALAEFRFVSPGALATFGIPLKAGREFDQRDGQQGTFASEIVVNQAFVDRYLGGGDALGQQVAVYDGSAKTIVGVVGNVHQFGQDQPVSAEVWFPVRTVPLGDLRLAVRVRGDPLALAPTLRRVLQDAFPDMPVYEVRTLDEVTGSTLRMRRFNVTLLGAFAAAALVLTWVGLYGVIAWLVAARRRELAVRRSFGATRGHILRLLLGNAASMVVPGIVLGAGGALVLGRVIASQLYDSGGSQPAILAAVASLLATLATLACLLPARRALRADPMTVLRND